MHPLEASKAPEHAKCTKVPRWMVAHLLCVLRNYRARLVDFEQKVHALKKGGKPALATWEARLGDWNKERHRVRLVTFDCNLEWPIGCIEGLSDAYKKEHLIAFRVDCRMEPKVLLPHVSLDISFGNTFEHEAVPEDPNFTNIDPAMYAPSNAGIVARVHQCGGHS